MCPRTDGWRTTAVAMCAITSLPACNGQRVPVREIVVNRVDSLVTSVSNILAGPVDVAIDSNSSVYVLDYSGNQVVRLALDGRFTPVAFGRVGSGPGEFRGPGALAVAHDSIRVVDQGNGRLVTLSIDGTFARAIPLPPSSVMGPVAIGAAGSFVTTTAGVGGSLAEYHDAAGALVNRLARPLDSVPKVVDPNAIREELIAGRVPSLFRNSVLPVVADDETIWLVLIGEGEIRRFDARGTERIAKPLSFPEMADVRAEAVAWARQSRGEPILMALRYVHDAVAVGDDLWLLLNTTDAGPAVVVGLDSNAVVLFRVRFPSIIGARAFATDHHRKRIVFAIPGDASVAAADLPDGLAPFLAFSSRPSRRSTR